MKKGFTALKSDEYKCIFRVEVKATEWAFDRIEEAFEQVAQDEARKMSIVQEIIIRSTDYIRRIIAPVGGQGGVTMSYLCPHCNSFTLGRLHLVCFRREKHTTWLCAICGDTTGSNQTGFWSYKQVKVLIRPRYSKHMQYLRACAQI